MSLRRRRALTLGLEFALACGVLVVAGAGPVIGEDATVRTLKSVASGRAAETDRLAAFRELTALDTTDSRKALEEFCDAKDDHLAATALLAIGRADQTGGRSKLKAVFEDTKRAHGARVAAFLAWANLQAKDGASWDAILGFAKQHYEAGSRLEASVAAAKNGLFPSSRTEGR